jgi:hypothetical protein
VSLYALDLKMAREVSELLSMVMTQATKVAKIVLLTISLKIREMTEAKTR